MAGETTGAEGRAERGAWAGRVAMPALAVSALALVAAVAGGVALIVPGISHPAWLATATEIAALVGLLFANAATGLQFVGAWRVLRGLERYNPADDAKSQALQAPGLLQDAPAWLRGRFGCQMALSVTLLVATLLATGATTLPAAWQAASGGASVQANGIAPANVTPSPDPMAAMATQSPEVTPSPTATPAPPSKRSVAPSPTATPTIVFSVSPTYPPTDPFYCTGAYNPAPYTVTLDNTRSNGTATWSFAATDTLTSGAPWATASPSRGTVPAGQTATFTLTPDPHVCNGASWTYHAEVKLASGGSGPYMLYFDTKYIG